MNKKFRLSIFVVFIISLSFFACQTERASNITEESSDGDLQLINFLMPVRNNVLVGSISNFYEAVDNGLIDPNLWIYLEKGQMVLSRVRILAINRYDGFGQEIITVSDVGIDNSYSFLLINESETVNEFNDFTFVGDEIFVLWTQGGLELENAPLDRFIGTRVMDIRYTHNIFRAIIGINRRDSNLLELADGLEWN